MQRMELDEAFKEEEHPFRIAIVCAMWLTGFDVPSLSTLYLDKPLKAHTLMQAIARANRVNEGKNNGLIVDYCGILKHLRKALATFAGTRPGWRRGGETDPAKPEEELLADLAEAIALVRASSTSGTHRWTTSSRRPASSATPPSWPARRRPTRTTRPASASR